LTERRSISEKQAESFDQINAITLSGGFTGQSGAVLKRALRPGDIVGGSYRLETLLGRGGMGYVFAVRHILLDRDYALKMLAPEQLNDAARLRFENEGRAIAKLEHGNIVKVYDMGLDQGTCPYYVMDKLRGDSLDDLIKRRGALPFKIAIGLLGQIVEGLRYAHSKGIIHRDMKPSNVVIINEAQGKLTAKIVDFGIAKFLPASNLQGQSQTATGQVFGSPLYMSPEQSMGDHIDERSDIYSLGCTIYEMLTGKAPFRGENALQTILMHQSADIPDAVKNAAHPVPETVQILVDRCLAKKAADRYQSMEQLLHDIERLEHGQSIARSDSASALMSTYTNTNSKKWTRVSNRSVVIASISLMSVVLATGLLWLGYNAYRQKGDIAKTDARLASISSESVTTNNRLVKGFDNNKLTVAQVVINKRDEELINKIRESWKNFGPVKSEIVQTAEGKRRRFHFPRYKCGALTQPNAESKDAKGMVDVLTDSRLRFDVAGDREANLSLAVPEFIDHFPVNVFQSVNLRKPLGKMMDLASDQDNQLALYSMHHILQAISKWTQLGELWLMDINLTEENCLALDNCKSLKQLTLDNCGVSRDIGKHVFLRRLVDVRIDKCAYVNSFLEALKSSQALQVLHIENCQFEPSVLAQMNDAPLIHTLDLILLESRNKKLNTVAKTPSTDDTAELPSEEELEKANEKTLDTSAHDGFDYLKTFEHHSTPMLFLMHGRHLTLSDIVYISSWQTTAALVLEEKGYTPAEKKTIKSSRFGSKVTFQHFY
jgi:serine/threonine protein kinase